MQEISSETLPVTTPEIPYESSSKIRKGFFFGIIFRISPEVSREIILGIPSHLNKKGGGG